MYSTTPVRLKKIWRQTIRKIRSLIEDNIREALTERSNKRMYIQDYIKILYILKHSFHNGIKKNINNIQSGQFSSVAQLCLTLCDPMNRSTPGLPVHHQLSEFTQTHAHRVSDAIQPSHPLSSPSPIFPSTPLLWASICMS